jgi:hypothetical protein
MSLYAYAVVVEGGFAVTAEGRPLAACVFANSSMALRSSGLILAGARLGGARFDGQSASMQVLA